MSERFDAEKYAEKWERIIIPLMTIAIILSFIGAFAIQYTTETEDKCTTNYYIYCGDYVTPGYTPH
ncbi:MAG: hypothetical protein ACOH5I_14240 [Oligoflexus sp.]